VILCSLDANLERPELRRFSGDPVATVLANRGAYIAAALTIVRAYIEAGCPDPCPPIASFGDWSRLVRSSLVWLGRADPIDTMTATRADDPERINLRAVVSAWAVAVGHGPNTQLSTGELVDVACSANPNDKEMSLQKALLAVASVRGRNEIDARALGRWLGRNRGRVIDGLKIADQEDSHSKQRRWWLQSMRG
jgi:putative DNA primase/helicase